MITAVCFWYFLYLYACHANWTTKATGNNQAHSSRRSARMPTEAVVVWAALHWPQSSSCPACSLRHVLGLRSISTSLYLNTDPALPKSSLNSTTGTDETSSPGFSWISCFPVKSSRQYVRIFCFTVDVVRISVHSVVVSTHLVSNLCASLEVRSSISNVQGGISPCFVQISP